MSATEPKLEAGFMKSLLRLLFCLLMMGAMLLLSNCSPYGCNVTFGSSTCTPSGSGLGSGGGTGGGTGGGNGNATPAALVYAVDQTGGSGGSGTNGTIDAYDLSTSAGSFLALKNFTAPAIPVNDPAVAMVVVQKKFLYALFESTNQIFGWSINSSNGTLTPLTNFPLAVILNLPQLSYNDYAVITDPAGKYLFIANTGLNEIMVFTVDSTSGALAAVSGSPFPTLFAPVNLATDGLGKFLYVSGDTGNHTSAAMEGFSIGSNGALTIMPGSPFTFTMWQLQGEATGKYMIGTTGNTLSLSAIDDLNLYLFSINQTSGVLTQVAKQPTTYSPFTIAAQPPSSNGKFVYSFSMNDTATGYNPIEGFQLDTSNGTLAPISGSPFGVVTPGLWGQFDQSGANLLVYSNISIDVIDEIFGGGTVQLIPVAVASSGGLTPPISPATLVTPGYWVVTDP
jgi:6-phosphogluconolactonase (cycloisomerase 2 family)